MKDAIRASATRLFAEQGFQATGVRDIAAAAGADPALVIRHFGSKEGLFLDTMSVSPGWSALLDGPLEGLGERLVAALLAAHAEGGLRPWAALLRASDRPEVAGRLRETARRTLIDPVVARLDDPEAEERAAMLATLVEGLLLGVVVREDALLARMPDERLARWYGSLIDHALTGPLPPP